jgi:hypothetical protein
MKNSGALTEKYAGKYANGLHNNPGVATQTTRVVKVTPPREGKYSNRINQMVSQAVASQRMTNVDIYGSAPAVEGGLGNAGLMTYAEHFVESDSAAMSPGGYQASRRKTANGAQNFYESLESTNLTATLNLFIAP